MFKFLEFFTEALAWLKIVASPLLLGLIVGAVVYISDPSSTGLAIGIAIAAVGLIIGIVWATNVWKTKGTVNFTSRVMASPDLDKKENTTESKKK